MADMATLAGSWVEVCPVNTLNPGDRKCFTLPTGEPCILVNSEGNLLCVSATCTHRDLSIEEGRILGGCIVCPWHRAKFDLATGKATPPAPRPLPTFDVAVVAGIVHVRAKEDTA
jgi:nitrite reductase/ring-hydroxylating ferredoxin subunit